MQKSWTNQNINIHTLMERIIKYLEKEDFDLTVYQEEKGYTIIAENSKKYDLEGGISIQIEGEPNEFTIKMKESRREVAYRFPLLLSTMLGGGYLLLKRLKSNEKYIEFTRDFWQNVNKILLEMKMDEGEGVAKPLNRG